MHVLTWSQAGLFSAVTSAFIIEVNSELQPDPNEESAALLRVLIHKIDNTTFGNSPPTLPQWTGPPPVIVQVQAILFASLTASLFSAFLAMLGKQWLNRYASTDLRGSAIERSQNRQRKLDGIVTWYFNPLMETPPLMLQVALLLLGYALSRYLWGVSVAVASVVLAVTSSGVLFYIFIIIAGIASESCPYQTPGSLILCYLGPRVWGVPHWAVSVIVSAFRGSKTIELIKIYARHHFGRQCIGNIMPFLKDMVHVLPHALATDVYCLGKIMIWPLAKPLTNLAHKVHSWLHGASPTPEQKPDHQLAVLNLRCISWMLQTSLDNTVRLSALKHLSTTITTPTSYDPTLVTGCFNTFLSCVIVNSNSGTVVVVQGLEELAMESALCFFTAVSHALLVDPTPNALKNVCQHYTRVFPTRMAPQCHQSYYTVRAACCLFVAPQACWQYFQWRDYKPSTYEHTIVAHNLLKLTRFEYQRAGSIEAKGFCEILYFAMYSLSLDPPAPTSVIADCLLIIAIELGCEVSEAGIMMLDERCVYL